MTGEKTNLIDAAEFDAAKALAKTSGDCYTHTFQTPFLYEGRELITLTFDFSKLTGADSLAAENELAARNIPLIVPAFSGEYLIRICARACDAKIGADAFAQMPLRDYNRIRSAARSFLLRSDL